MRTSFTCCCGQTTTAGPMICMVHAPEPTITVTQCQECERLRAANESLSKASTADLARCVELATLLREAREVLASQRYMNMQWELLARIDAALAVPSEGEKT
jgi:hypothetical protein